MPELTDIEIKALADAFLTESLSAAKNEIFALKAKAEGYPQAERLFVALAKAQAVHAKKCLMLLRGSANVSVENMAETASILDMLSAQYTAVMEQVSEDGKADAGQGAATGFLEQFKKTAMNHRALVSQMDEQKPAAYHVCTVCGFVYAGEVRGRCPVCEAVESKFEAVE